jgi:mono/diheme cytochrome c family protein
MKFLLPTLLPFAAAAAAPVDFVREVRPIFETHCYECHGEKKQKSGLRLDVKSAALKGGDKDGPNIVAGDPGKSSLVEFITSEDKDERMPPKGERLSADEVGTI